MQRKKPEDTVRASFRRKYCAPITEVTICDNVNLACFCLLVLLLWFLRAIKRRRPEHVFMIWPTTFFFWRTFCPTFGINWTERIYSLTNLLLLCFICIRFIFCLKKVLLDYSIQVLDQEPRKIYREYTELTKSCLNRKIAGRLGHPWFSSTPTGGSQEGSTQNEDWEWDLIETCSLVFALAPVPKVKVKVTLWSWLCAWGPGDSVIRIDSFQTVNVENLDVNFLLSPKLLFRGILLGFVIFFYSVIRLFWMLLLLLFIDNLIFRSLRRRWKHWKIKAVNTWQQLYPRKNRLKFEVLVFEERGKAEYQEKKPQEARTNNKPSHKGSTPFKTSGGIQCKHTK